MKQRLNADMLALPRELSFPLLVMDLGRRVHFRVPTAARVDWHARGTCTHHVSTTRDWSRGGVFIRTDIPRAPGELLHVLMDVGEVIVQFEATVAHRCKDGMGVRVDSSSVRIL